MPCFLETEPAYLVDSIEGLVGCYTFEGSKTLNPRFLVYVTLNGTFYVLNECPAVIKT